MTMKQTQTKMFDFSDVGLDFCAGSKNLFPDRFKKMLSLGYNEQTVSSVAVTGNQVVLTYGVNHGYVADRVLKITSGALAAINDGEFWIDSVTANTVTMTIDDAPISIAGGFITKIASLGWQLMYEQANIHIYKFKHINESDLYIRFCFQNQSARRNCIGVCVGKLVNLTTGVIEDPNALVGNSSILTPDTGFKWEYQTIAGTTHDNYSYAQGYSIYGLGKVVGSIYHFITLTNGNTGNLRSMINAVVPTHCFNYEMLDYPILIGYTYGNITSAFEPYEARNQTAYVGPISVVAGLRAAPNSSFFDNLELPASDYLSKSIDTFYTTTTSPIFLYEAGTRQLVGVILGIYRILCSVNLYPVAYQSTPSETYDIDLQNKILIHSGGSLGGSVGTESTNTYFIACGVEEIKIGT